MKDICPNCGEPLIEVSAGKTSFASLDDSVKFTTRIKGNYCKNCDYLDVRED